MFSSTKNKSKVTPGFRVKQFANVSGNGLSVREGQLWCSACGTTVTHGRKSSVKKHLDSPSHKQRLDVAATTPSVKDVVKNVDHRRTVWETMVGAFAAAGVPLHVFSNENVRSWLQENVKLGQTLPSETTLRKYLVNSGDSDFETTVSKCRDKDVILIVDESTDIKNRKLLNILVQPTEKDEKPRLAFSKFLDKCDSSSVANAVLESLSLLQISTSQVVCMKSDNVRYMLSAGTTLKGICQRMIHSTCWAHILHLVAEEIRGKFKKADKFIASLKQSLIKAPARRLELLDTFERHQKSRQLPPFPVITRWCTWLACGEYIFSRFDAISEWIEGTEDNSIATKTLKELLEDKDEVKTELKQIYDISPGLCSSLRKLESNHLPASSVWFVLETVIQLTNDVLGEASKKLRGYMETKHPARDFWYYSRFFDPRFASQVSADLTIPSAIGIFGDNVPIIEMATYRTLVAQQGYGVDFDAPDFWKSYSKEMPALSALALKISAIPSSTSDVERSFSCLRRVLTPLRNQLTEENLGIHLRLAFNSNKMIQDYNHITWDDDV